MDAQQIKAFMDAMALSDLTEMEASKDGWTLRLVRGGARLPVVHAEVASPAASGTLEQAAALCGVVFLQPAPGEPPFVQPGDTVTAGQTLCVIEAMKVFNEVLADTRRHRSTRHCWCKARRQDVELASRWCCSLSCTGSTRCSTPS